jgi:hypothetical protein
MLGIIFLLWILPLVQQFHPFVQLRALDGAVTYSPDDTLTRSSWFDGSYGRNKENYLNEQFGFRNFFVRSRNQVYFSLLKVPTAKGVVIGKDNFLYEEKYITSYTGQDFIGENAMREKMRKLKFVSDTLKKLNIDLILLFAPGKATYYPEYIPDHYFKNADTANTNYKLGSRMAREAGLNFIDYNALFKSLKKTTKYPLFPKTGIHWSYYASHFAFDTLSRYIEHLTGRRLRHYKYDKVEWSYQMRDVDEDIGAGLNTLFQIRPLKMAYANVEYEPLANQYRPKVITISDSFWGGIYYSGLASHVFDKPQYWYFYNQNMDYSSDVTDPMTYNLKSKIEENNIIILMTTESHVSDMGWGFIEDAYDLYAKGEPYLNGRDIRLKVLRMGRWIRTDPKLMFETKIKAKQMNIPLDSMVTLEAYRLYGIDPEMGKPVVTPPSTPTERIKEFLLADAELSQELRAKTDKKSSDEIVLSKAKQIYNSRNTCHFKAVNGKLLCADEYLGHYVLANREKAALWETFDLFMLDDKRCAISCYTGMFLSVDLNAKAEITANREKIAGWEVFEISFLENGSIALKAANGKFVSMDKNSTQLIANSDVIGPTEKFKIVRQHTDKLP